MFAVTLCLHNSATKIEGVDFSCIVCDAIGVHVEKCGMGDDKCVPRVQWVRNVVILCNMFALEHAILLYRIKMLQAIRTLVLLITMNDMHSSPSMWMATGSHNIIYASRVLEKTHIGSHKSHHYRP